MEMTFDYIGMQASPTGLFGEKAYGILCGMYTSSVISLRDGNDLQLIKVKGEKVYEVMRAPRKNGWWVCPGAGPSGEVELRTVQRVGRHYYQGWASQAKESLEKDVSKLCEQVDELTRRWTVKRRVRGLAPDQDPVIVFPTMNGEFEAKVSEIHCLRYLLQHNCAPTKRGTILHGAETIGSLLGTRLNPLKAGANEVALQDYVSKLEASAARCHAIEISGASVEEKKAAVAKNREEVESLVREMASKLGVDDEERIQLTLLSAL